MYKVQAFYNTNHVKLIQLLFSRTAGVVYAAGNSF